MAMEIFSVATVISSWQQGLIFQSSTRARAPYNSAYDLGNQHWFSAHAQSYSRYLQKLGWFVREIGMRTSVLKLCTVLNDDCSNLAMNNGCCFWSAAGYRQLQNILSMGIILMSAVIKPMSISQTTLFCLLERLLHVLSFCLQNKHQKFGNNFN